jgi:hypothetical protein
VASSSANTRSASSWTRPTNGRMEDRPATAGGAICCPPPLCIRSSIERTARAVQRTARLPDRFVHDGRGQAGARWLRRSARALPARRDRSSGRPRRTLAVTRPVLPGGVPSAPAGRGARVSRSASRDETSRPEAGRAAQASRLRLHGWGSRTVAASLPSNWALRRSSRQPRRASAFVSASGRLRVSASDPRAGRGSSVVSMAVSRSHPKGEAMERIERTTRRGPRPKPERRSCTRPRLSLLGADHAMARLTGCDRRRDE